jgi:hypothetical protein
MSTQTPDSAKKTSSNDLDRQLGLYALAAVAAGVSMLALAQPAAGEVVVTRKTIPIPLSSLGEEGVGISFANNGVADLKLVLSSFSIFGNNGNSLKAVNATEGEGVLGGALRSIQRRRIAAALAPGARIGPSAHFVSAACGGTYFSCPSAVFLAGTHTSTFGSRNVRGPWAGNPKNGYLGVRFSIDGEPHYGWVRLTVNTAIPRGTRATITAYAYETVPNEPIVAGTAEEASSVAAPLQENDKNTIGPSLGTLALGADGLSLWRREETLTSK